MTAPVLFLERGWRGFALIGARLIGADFDDAWRAGEGDDPEDAPRAVAAWAGEALAAQRLPKRVGSVVLDTTGASCGWVTLPGRDASVVPALVRQHAMASVGVDDAGDAPAFGGSTAPGATLGADADLPGAASVEALSGGGDRVAAVAVPDASVRVLLDAMDEIGLRVGATRTLWQTLAQAWCRPLGRAADNAGVVAEQAGVSAVLLVEPRGRLSWCWADEHGMPIAAGSQRLPGEGGVLHLGAEQAGRLATDWLAWAGQLGRGPTRVRTVLPAGAFEDAAAAGFAAGSAWGDAATELITDEDPVARTCRAAGERDEGAAVLRGLTGRAGRDHRAAYRWSAIAVASCAALVGLVGFALSGARAGFDEDRAALRDRWSSSATAVGADALEPIGPRNVALVMESLLATERRAAAPAEPAYTLLPVMPEVEALAFVIGNEFVRLTNMSVTQTSGQLSVTVSDPTAFREIDSAIRGVSGAQMQWSRLGNQRGGEGALVYNGRWPTDAGDR